MMTAEQLDLTKASREMDIAVALEIMNWQEITERPEEWGGTLATVFTLIGGDPAIQERGPWYFPPDTDPLTTIGGCTVPHYSETIAAAMFIADEMLADDYQFLLTSAVAGDHCAEFCHVDCIRRGRHSSYSRALSICVAALKARGVIE